MKTLDELSGYDKAAIIFDILGDSLSINMFQDIPETECTQTLNLSQCLEGNCPNVYQTIQDAIDEAPVNAVICIPPGDYKVDGEIKLKSEN